MNIKKIIILIAFFVFSVLASKASACTIYDPGCSQYEHTLPQIYDNAYVGPQNTAYPMYQDDQPGIITRTVYQPAPYIPQAPIIMGNDTVYTGTQYGTSTSTTQTSATNSNNSQSNDSGTIFDGIFGSKKKIFSNGSDTVEADQNLQALVNSKGLAIGTNGGVCSNNKEEYLILYKNLTGVALTQVALRMSLPTGITPTNTSGGSYSERDNTVTFFIGTLTPNQTGQILLPVKKTGTIEGVARSEMVYTLPDQNQNMIVAYSFGNGTCAQSSLGASVIGSGVDIFGGTLMSWIFLALFVALIIYVIRFFARRGTAHGHDTHGHGH